MVGRFICCQSYCYILKHIKHLKSIELRVKTYKQNKMENKFNIDFFELCFLAEACIPPRPIARAMFWNRLINEHYYNLTEEQRQKMYDWINKCYSMEEGIKDKNDDCLLFNARFDKDNQYKIETNYKGEKQIHLCFKLENQYHISKSTSILEDYITKITKL